VIPDNGSTNWFVPEHEADQLVQGEEVLSAIAEAGARIIAEDLGTVPDFVRESLGRLKIAGYKVFRWEREWDRPRQPFIDPVCYPRTSVATSGTHDTEPLAIWWNEADAAERRLVEEIPSLGQSVTNVSGPFTSEIRDALLETLFAAGSDLLILPIQDVFGWTDRINVPATVGDDNWTFKLPWPVDRLRNELIARERAATLRRWSERYDRMSKETSK
jgi:4-alpha-glucanotransferase